MKNELDETFRLLLLDLFHIDVNQYSMEDLSLPFLSSKFCFTPYMLFSLFMEIERLFNIRFTENEIVDRQFNSYHTILSLLKKHCA